MINIYTNKNHGMYDVRHYDSNMCFDIDENMNIKHNRLRRIFFEELLNDLNTGINILNQVKATVEKEMFDRIG